MSANIMKIGQSFKGKSGIYTIVQQLQESVWLASNDTEDHFIFKSVQHFRLQNERDVLKRFQGHSTHIRPLLDEIDDPPAIILKYLQHDLLQVSNTKDLTRNEIKFVARHVLEALKVLHQDGFVHTDIKPSNVLVNCSGDKDMHFKDVEIADFGSTVSQESKYALDGDPIGTPMFRSPEAQLGMRWGTPTDIWSFGTMLIGLIYGAGFQVLRPSVPVDDDDYEVQILLKQHRIFGPFPASYDEIADKERLAVILWVMENSPPNTLKPFHLTTEREISKTDKDFICGIMKLDPRDRPTAAGLLKDPWFQED